MSSREFELATGNLLIGRFTWLFIYLPEGWRVKPGDSPTDVNYTTVIKDMGWVVDGSASYYIVNLVNGAVLELDVKCSRGIKTPKQGANIEVILINGHQAYITSKVVKRGLRRQLHTQTNVQIPCTNTSRTVELTITGRSDFDIEELKRYFAYYRCH